MATLPEFKGEDYKFPDEQEAAVEDKFEVEIEDDTPEEDRGRKPMKAKVEEVTEDELSEYDERVQARIKKLGKGYHDERRAKEEALREREAAETLAKQVYEENKRLQQQLSTGSKAYIETSKSAAEIKLSAAKKKFRDAAESGDYDTQGDAQAEIAQAMMELQQANTMKPVEVEEREEFTPAASETPAQPAATPRMEKWFKANREWWGVDEEMTLAAMGIDKKLQREYGAGYVGTEEYFQTIDKTMRKRFPEQFEDAQSYEDDEPPPQKRTSDPAYEDDPPRRATKPAAVVAPASRSTPPNRIKLKGSEAAIARRLGVPIEEYAKQVAKLRRGE